MAVKRSQGRLHFKRAAHAALRVAVFERDNYTCRGCGWRPLDEQIPADYDGRYVIGFYPNPRADRLLQVDHVHPRALGGQPTIENLQTLCDLCNMRKNARTDWVLSS